MNVFVGLEFDNSELAVAGAGQQIDHAAIRCGKGWDLRIDVARVESCIEQRYILLHFGFKPSLWLHAPQWVFLIAFRSAELAQSSHQIFKQRFGLFCKQSFMRAAAEDDLRRPIEAVVRAGNARSRKLQPMQAEAEFC